MDTDVKIDSKYLLKDNTLKMFLVSSLSFVLRWGSIGGYVLLVYEFVFGDFLEYLLEYSVPKNNIFLLGGGISVLSLLGLFVLQFSSALKLGEYSVYSLKSRNNKCNFRCLFRFLSLKKSARALLFYVKLNFLKFLWFGFFTVPVFMFYLVVFYVKTFVTENYLLFYVMVFLASVMFSFSLFMWRASLARYALAPLFMCKNIDLKSGVAIKRSIEYTEGNLVENVILENSLLGWLLSCIFIVPLVYVVPYWKLCKIRFLQIKTKKKQADTMVYNTNFYEIKEG
ncbi:MAG: hypothetical protein ACI4IF_02920 [Acutalibacteraceae bacterium]